DQFHPAVMRSIPALIVPFRMIRAEHLVLRALPALTSLNPTALVKRNRRNLLRLWLRAEVRVLRFDLLHLLRVRLLRLGPRISLCVLLAGCRSWRSCTGFSQRLLHTLLVLLNLLLPAVGWHSGRLTGHSRSRRVSIRRFLMRPSLPAFSSTRLIRRSTGRLTGNICFWRGR